MTATRSPGLPEARGPLRAPRNAVRLYASGEVRVRVDEAIDVELDLGREI